MTPLTEGSFPEPEPTPVQGEAPVDPSTEESRRYPSTIGGACYLVILALTVIGLVVVALGHWRGGVHAVAVALVAAGVVRAVLPRRDAGMLEVRNRWFDTVLLVAVGVAVWVLASTIPNAA